MPLTSEALPLLEGFTYNKKTKSFLFKKTPWDKSKDLKQALAYLRLKKMDSIPETNVLLPNGLTREGIMAKHYQFDYCSYTEQRVDEINGATECLCTHTYGVHTSGVYGLCAAPGGCDCPHFLGLELLTMEYEP